MVYCKSKLHISIDIQKVCTIRVAVDNKIDTLSLRLGNASISLLYDREAPLKYVIKLVW